MPSLRRRRRRRSAASTWRGATAAAAYECGLKERIVFSEFPSVEKAIEAYNSPGYQEALKALGDGAERDVRIVAGLE